MRALITLLLLVGLASCAARTEPYRTVPLPTGVAFASAVPAGHTRYSNTSIAEIFVKLVFGLESGESRAHPVRFNQPISVGVTGNGGALYLDFIDRFLAQIKTHTGIDIARRGGPHDLLVRFVPGADFAVLQPNQCIVVSRQPDLAAFLADYERYDARIFENSDEPISMSVFIPDTAEPYEIRECVMEEITQALGTGNDLYGLAHTIFNDDNAHSWPTRLDYLMLRLLYHPKMRTDLNRVQTLELAKVILDEMNPDGRGAPALPRTQQQTFLKWRNMLQHMAGSDDSAEDDLRTVEKLVSQSSAIAPQSAYHCESETMRGHVRHNGGRADALEALDRAIEVCTKAHGKDDIRIAHLRLTRGFAQLGRERYRDALSSIEGLESVFLAFGQEQHLAATYIVRTAARILIDDGGDTGALRDQVVRWGAYAFGDDNEIVEKWRLR